MNAMNRSLCQFASLVRKLNAGEDKGVRCPSQLPILNAKSSLHHCQHETPFFDMRSLMKEEELLIFIVSKDTDNQSRADKAEELCGTPVPVISLLSK